MDSKARERNPIEPDIRISEVSYNYRPQGGRGALAREKRSSAEDRPSSVRKGTELPETEPAEFPAFTLAQRRSEPAEFPTLPASTMPSAASTSPGEAAALD